MFWLSIITAITSVCGLPWICASTVHSITHVKSLSDTAKDPATGVEKVTNVTETRWTPLVLNLLIGLSIVCLKPVLAQIPMCVLSGLFFYLGLAAMRGNEFLERVSMTLITDPEQMPKSHPLVSGGVKLDVLKKFTIMQIVCLGIMWWVKGSPRRDAVPYPHRRAGPRPHRRGQGGLVQPGGAQPARRAGRDRPRLRQALSAFLPVRSEYYVNIRTSESWARVCSNDVWSFAKEENVVGFSQDTCCTYPSASKSLHAITILQ